jgi:hypothetical protein
VPLALPSIRSNLRSGYPFVALANDLEAIGAREESRISLGFNQEDKARLHRTHISLLEREQENADPRKCVVERVV